MCIAPNISTPVAPLAAARHKGQGANVGYLPAAHTCEYVLFYPQRSARFYHRNQIQQSRETVHISTLQCGCGCSAYCEVVCVWMWAM
mmetsp:Transcript_49342/g.82777  ORF Transcript_49342/g.82777 Transcript_49342/m.82777 type:complete len:87 (+) Transcript_49342:524-784(+)